MGWIILVALVIMGWVLLREDDHETYHSERWDRRMNRRRAKEFERSRARREGRPYRDYDEDDEDDDED